MILDSTKAYLLLGSNLGDRELYLERALKLIEERVGNILSKSAVYETAAWGNTAQPGFLNIAVEVSTTLQPLALLQIVLEIEKQLGRVRHEKWGSRLIDIDIILYGNEIIDVKGELQIPHPEMQHRKFVMEPLVAIAPKVMHPILNCDMETILANLVDPLTVEKR